MLGKKHYLTLTILILSFGFTFSQEINWPEFVAKHDLNWNNTVDSNFFHGAFIGDGVQGAMIMQDPKNPNGIRMLMAHYKAISHTSIPNFEYCVPKVYAGNIVITPRGKKTYQTMRMNLYDGEVSGVITTDSGMINWRVFAERNNKVFVVILKGNQSETDAKLGIREEWGISPKIYLDKKNPSDYATYLPPKPELVRQDDMDLVINKMKSKGAHVVASQLLRLADSTQVLYVAIGTSDNSNLSLAADEAELDAVTRLQAVINEGWQSVTIRHKTWWNNYMQSNYLDIQEEPYWQKFRLIQLYKLASASSENSDLIMDTQGSWIWQAGWAGVWWNLNVQLSYFPMYTANKLEAGKAFIRGMDRIYKSGAFSQNAGGVGINVGRSSTYDGIGNWGDEYGNMPWLLQLYWKYWKFSGNDSIGQALFPMLKDNSLFLASKLKMGTDGKYHMVPSRSPEYEDTGGGALHADANYGLMSAYWVYKTLLEMDAELEIHDPERTFWEEKLAKLTAFPTDANGFRVNADQGFDIGHRHFSHLLAFYPYHLVTPEQGPDAAELLEKSLERWQILSQASGAAGYTFTSGCAMYATLGMGDKAIATLDLMKSRNLIQLNTMYYEGGGAVIETPLAAVESIDYLLLQSWNGIIRIFPAVPSRWKHISMKNFRSEGAFLVSAEWGDGTISGLRIFSEKGRKCTLHNPWKGKALIVRDEAGNRITYSMDGGNCSFGTLAGNAYLISPASVPAIVAAETGESSQIIRFHFSEAMVVPDTISGFSIIRNDTDTMAIEQTTYLPADSMITVQMTENIINTDELSFSYSGGGLMSSDSILLKDISMRVIDNFLPGSAPRLLSACTDSEGNYIELTFNKKMKASVLDPFEIMNQRTGQIIPLGSQTLDPGDSVTWVLNLSSPVFMEDTMSVSYNGQELMAWDNGILKSFTGFPVQNSAPGLPPDLVRSAIIMDGEAIQLEFDKRLTDSKSQLSYFRVFVNGTRVTLASLSTFFNTITISLANSVNYKDSIELSFSEGTIRSIDRGELTAIPMLGIENTLPVSKIVSQSSTAYNGYAKLAVDGNTNGTFFGGSVSHTAENVSNPWWMWDMEQVDSLVSVTLWNRTDCCGERLANFYVFVSKKPFSSANPLTVAADTSVWKYYYAGKAGEKTIIKVNACGRFLRIQIKGIGTLSLAEVQVSKKNGICPEFVPNGIDAFSDDEDVKVYPNPVQSNIFTIKYDNAKGGENCVFRLQDLSGRILPAGVRPVDSGFEFTTREPFVKGVYFLTIITDKRTFTRKIIVE
jgi:hypothetical protein